MVRSHPAHSQHLFDYPELYQWMQRGNKCLQQWQENLAQHSTDILCSNDHNFTADWLAAYQELPQQQAQHVILDQATVIIGQACELAKDEQGILHDCLSRMRPWRKGPFSFFDIFIDTEWRSDWKWSRLQPHLTPLRGKTVLDVGCGSGYHLWRMLGEGVERAIGIEPFPAFVLQFLATRHFLQNQPAYVLPFGLEELPVNMGSFDVAFSMGVLYHRKSPIDHISELLQCLKPGGEVYLETLLVEGPSGHILVPPDRYAQMRNVWFLPTALTLENWMTKCGFVDIELIDLNTTSTQEQRSTPWMPLHSLDQYLDPQDPGRTIEGHPAPLRGFFKAKRRS